MTPVIQECPKCHKKFTLGVNGIITGCDLCEGVSRASNGFAIDDQPQCTCMEFAGDNVNCPIHFFE